MIESIVQSTHTKDEKTTALKVPPYSIEAEQAVLGSILLSNEAWEKIADVISEVDFYRADHRIIFRAIERLSEQDNPFDAVTLSEWLDRNDLLEKVGGLAYLGALVKDTPSAANVRAYAELVRDRSVTRQLIDVGTDIANSGYQPEGRTSKQLLDQAETRIFEISDQNDRSEKGTQNIQKHIAKAFKRIDKLFNSDDPITGVPTSYDKFDEMTSGLQESDLIVIAGRPSMGKTSFAMNIAENAAIKHNVPVLVFSMEMSGESLAMRLMSSLGRINQHKVRTGDLDDDDWVRLTSAMGILSEAPLFIDDTPALTPTEVRARARRIKREHGLGLIVIDYLQLMQTSGSSENRTNEISEISRSLKALAKELDVPVIALSQLNRSLEQRPNKRPVMSDLRESGAIEQDADLITFIYRDEVYNEDSPDKGVAEIIIGKQRNGPIGTVRLTFLGQFTRFENFATESYSNLQQMPPTQSSEPEPPTGPAHAGDFAGPFEEGT
jgi:replicative DNA helicase